MNELSKIVNNEMGADLPIRYEPNPLSNFVFDGQADIGKAREKLKFTAKYDLSSGIKKVLDSLD
ncbi:MAG: hypothetical protein WC926_00870 [Candidatus Paceibacterota bacterium]